MSMITVRDVSLGYERNSIVEGLNFSVDCGDYLCLVGENGSGKTTLMKALLGAKRVLSGKIEFSDGLKRNEIGYLPQQTEVQRDFPASVSEIVLSGCLNAGGPKPFYTKSQKETARANMERLGIYDMADKGYRELSGGQQQRVLLARALCAAKKLLLLDEPAAGLDPPVTKSLYKIIAEINGDGIAVITATHDVSAAVEYASHILHVGARPLFFGLKKDYVKSDVYRRFTSWGGDVI